MCSDIERPAILVLCLLFHFGDGLLGARVFVLTPSRSPKFERVGKRSRSGKAFGRKLELE